MCPRIVKATHVKDTISLVNGGLQVKCAEKEVTFADSTSSFYLIPPSDRGGVLTALLRRQKMGPERDKVVISVE